MICIVEKVLLDTCESDTSVSNALARTLSAQARLSSRNTARGSKSRTRPGADAQKQNMRFYCHVQGFLFIH